MNTYGSGGAVGAGGGWYTAGGAGGGGGGATYQDCGENSDAAAVSLTMRSDMRNDALTIADLRPAGAGLMTCGAADVPGVATPGVATPPPRVGSMVCDVSGISTTYPAHAAAMPMRTLA